MPSMTCKCGHRITYGEIPCRDQWLFISDEAYDKFSGDVDAEDIYRCQQRVENDPPASEWN
jgi:hypothetical protein